MELSNFKVFKFPFILKYDVAQKTSQTYRFIYYYFANILNNLLKNKLPNHSLRFKEQ